VSKIKIPGVRRKRAKGKTYYYWARSEAWVRLPDPLRNPDEFMRKVAHLQRIEATNLDRAKTGTFGGLVAAYRQTKAFRESLAPNTREVYERYLKRLLARYHAAPLAEITPEDIQVHVLDANEDTPGAANAMLSILRVLYEFAVRRNRHLRHLEDWTKKLESFPRDEANERHPWPDHILDEALGCDDELFRYAMTLALYTGQRPGDVCAMTWGKVKGDEIEVRQQKTGKHLTIPMHDDLRAMLNATTRSDRHLFILSNRRGDPLTPGTWLKWCQHFTRARGFRGTAHGLRKNATNALFEAGCTTAEVAAITGHRSIKMLEHYGKGRDQVKLGRVAMGKWGTNTKREREN
jgi:integrase